jgi:hypothetical protein
MTTHAKPTRKRGWLILLAIVVTVLACTWITIQAAGRARRQAAVDHIIEANEALMPGDLKQTLDRRGPDPSEWLAQVGAAHDLWDMAQLSDPHRYQELHDENVRGRNGEDARVAFERFEACIRPWLSEQKDSGAAWNAFWIDLSARLNKPDGTLEWGACQPAAIQLLAAGLARSMQLARAAAGYGPIDPQRVARKLDEEDAAFPRLPFEQEARVADALQVTALFHAQSQRFADAIGDVRAALAVADVHRPSPWLFGYVLWRFHVGRALDTLEALLPVLPRDLELGDLHERLTAMRPGTELATALRGERAFGYRVFESLRSGWTPKDDASFLRSSLWSRVQGWLVGDRDEAAYLESMSQAIELATQAAFLRKPSPKQPESSIWTPTTSVVLPALPSVMAGSDVLEARLALARAALTAYRSGAKDALAFLGQSVDPFDGRPIRCGFGEQGLVVFWSVGPDRKDDAAASGSDDIVWRLRLAE